MLELHAIYDKKSGSYSGIRTCVNADVAKRDLATIVNSGARNNTMCIYPSDFELYRIAYIDEKSGNVDVSFEFICNLSDLKEGE